MGQKNIKVLKNFVKSVWESLMTDMGLMKVCLSLDGEIIVEIQCWIILFIYILEVLLKYNSFIYISSYIYFYVINHSIYFIILSLKIYNGSKTFITYSYCEISNHFFFH